MSLFKTLKGIVTPELRINDIPWDHQNNAQSPVSQQPLLQPKPVERLYDSKLEALIDHALADGELTEKEKQVLFKRAEAMGIDLDEFEMVLDARLYGHNKTTNTPLVNTNEGTAAPSSNKFGDIKKCPACGAMVQSFTTRCVECGYEFQNIGTSQGIERLFEILNTIETQPKESTPRPQKSSGGFLSQLTEMSRNADDAMWEQYGGREKILQKKNIIQNFPIPTTKNDIIEFLTLAVPLAKVSFWSTDFAAKELAPVWKRKCEQIIMKAKFAMKDDKETLVEIAHYAKELKIKF